MEQAEGRCKHKNGPARTINQKHRSRRMEQEEARSKQKHEVSRSMDQKGAQ
jgi:hypothetical protein